MNCMELNSLTMRCPLNGPSIFDLHHTCSITITALSSFQITLNVQRLYGSQDSIQVRFQTYSGTATPGVDFKEILNGAITMDAGETASTIYVQVSRILSFNFGRQILLSSSKVKSPSISYFKKFRSLGTRNQKRMNTSLSTSHLPLNSQQTFTKVSDIVGGFCIFSLITPFFLSVRP